VRAVVSFGGRPDLAVFALAAVRAPTLLLVRSFDEASRHFAEIAASHLRDKHEVHVLPKLQGRFQESGEQDLVCTLATSWFVEAFSAWDPESAEAGTR
jgi:putative phosphoribosyl transferase